MSLETIIIQTGVGLNNINVRKGYDFRLFKLFKLNNCIDMFFFFVFCLDFKNEIHLIT